jgi:hypothetical protein
MLDVAPTGQLAMGAISPGKLTQGITPCQLGEDDTEFVTRTRKCACGKLELVR